MSNKMLTFSQGGKVGGVLRWQGVSKEERSKHAKMARSVGLKKKKERESSVLNLVKLVSKQKDPNVVEAIKRVSIAYGWTDFE